ncbi:MAG: hypothetical protein V3R52_06465 [Candidatus Neomarinimicrobiota bacterium]
MIKIILLTALIVGSGFSQTALYGLEGWYNITTVATAGGIGAVSNTDSDIINPAGIAGLTEQIQFSMIKYPAGISAQSALYVKTFDNSNIGIGLRHLNYGSFVATDENGFENGTYSAGDTWISTAWARKKQNINFGVTGGVFISNIESYNAIAMVFSTGIVYNFVKSATRFGISFSNIGVFVTRYTDQKENLPAKFILSASNGLAHLPLDLNFDIEFNLYNDDYYWRFGGIFALPYNLQLTVGINSNNVAQRTERSLIKKYLGSSAFGLGYAYKKYSIEIGGYSYGTGGWIYGTGLNIKF